MNNSKNVEIPSRIYKALSDIIILLLLNANNENDDSFCAFIRHLNDESVCNANNKFLIEIMNKSCDLEFWGWFLKLFRGERLGRA